MDFYRKVPTDLLEGNVQSNYLSILTLVTIVVLIITETSSFLKTDIASTLSMDYTPSQTIGSGSGSKKYQNTNPRNPHKLQINFNITMHALSCDYASVDVWDVLGTNQVDMNSNIEKWALAEGGERVGFKGRNRKAVEVLHDTDLEGNSRHGTIEELHVDGVHAIPVDEKQLVALHEEYDFVFVDFYAPW